ncbi:MAG: serine hydrolase domain-containing protein [Bacteroidota bacterium]
MKRIFIALAIFISGYLNAQVAIEKLVQYSDSVCIAGVKNVKVPGLVLGIASSDSIYLLKGYGYSDYDKKIVVDPEKTLFQIGSVGKLFTSISLLQQVEKNKISLDDDVNNYLDGWEIRNPFDQPVTSFHLLTHTGGFNDHFINYMAKSNAAIEPLEQHLPKNMPSVFKIPGAEINYSNYSYALAGHLVERVSGQSFEDQVQATVFDPLQMTSATYQVPDDYMERDLFAKGYKTRDTFEAVKMFPRHAKPAGSVAASGKDMLTFAQALLKRDTTLLKDESYTLLLTEQFTNHFKLTGYTMGMEVQNYGGHRAYAKAGQVIGFLSVLIVFPDLDLTLFISVNTQSDDHLDGFFKGVVAQFFPAEKVIPVAIDFNKNEYLGAFANERANHENVEEFFQLFQGQFTIYESKSGNLSAFHDNAHQEYQYLGNDVFQNLSNPDVYIVFKRKHGKIVSMHRNVNIIGVEVPASYRKLNWFERPRFLNDEYPYFLVVLVSYVLLPLLWVVRFYIRKRKPEFLRRQTIPFSYHAVAFLFLGLFFWNIIGFMVPLVKLREGMAFGFPESLVHMKYFNWAMALCSIVLILFSIHLWLRKKSTPLFRIYYTIFSLITLSYILLLYRWHFFNVDL